jgi:hypothetical protein
MLRKMADRPLGVSILCILSWIGSIILIGLGSIGAIAAIAIGAPLGLLLSLSILIIGILLFFVTFGLWQLKSWAFWIVMILNIIQIVLAIGTAVIQGTAGPIVGIIVPIIIVIYLGTVRDHFR